MGKEIRKMAKIINKYRAPVIDGRNFKERDITVIQFYDSAGKERNGRVYFDAVSVIEENGTVYAIDKKRKKHKVS